MVERGGNSRGKMMFERRNGKNCVPVKKEGKREANCLVEKGLLRMTRGVAGTEREKKEPFDRIR